MNKFLNSRLPLAVAAVFVASCLFVFAVLFLHDFAYASSVSVVIQAEDFDDGGEGVAYHDKTAENTGACGGDGYRENEGVDVCNNGSNPGCHVGHVRSGEWLQYTHHFQTSGTYAIDFFVGGPKEKMSGNILIDGEFVGSINPQARKDYYTFEPEAVEAQLTAGQHVIRVVFGDVPFTFDRFVIRSVDGIPADISGLSEGFKTVDYATHFFTTDKEITVVWDAAETGKEPDYYEVKLFDIDRGQVESESIGKTTENRLAFSLPRSGHFMAMVRACLEPSEDNDGLCSVWSYSTDETVASVGGKPRGWWLYGHLAPAGDIDITQHEGN